MKTLKQITIWALVVLMALTATPPVPAFASSESLDDRDPKPPKEGRIELNHRRTENAKIFLKSDGTKEAVVYQDPIHFEISHFGKKVYEEIDYDLSEKDSVFGSLLGDSFKNKKNNFDLSISKNLSGKAFTLQKNGTEVSVGVSDIRSQKGKKSFVSKENLKNLSYENNKNRVTYKNVTPGVDYTFYSMPDGIKEYIVINKYSGQNEFSFDIIVKNGYVLAQEDGAYKIFNSKTKEEVFTMPRFFMWDSKGGKDHIDNEYSYDLKTELKETKKGNYKLTVTANEAWLSAKERVFPIYIDPTYSTYSAEDTYVQSGYPTIKAWDQRALYVGRGSTKGINRALVKFNLPDLRGARINSAKFDVYQYGNCGGSCTWTDVYGYTTAAFNPWHVTWNTRPGNVSHVGTGRQTAAWGWFSMNVTSAARQWFPNHASYGGSYNGALQFIQSNESSWGFRTWASRNNPDYNWGQPKLTIDYNDYNAYYAPTTVPEMIAGTTVDVPIFMQNTGRNTWFKGGANPTKIGYHLVNNSTGEEVVWDGGWNDLPHDVARGGTVSAIVKVKAPPVSGSYTLRYDLVHSGITWFSHQGVPTVNRTINVYPPSLASMTHLGQEDYYAMAGPVDLVNGNLSYSTTDFSIPSNTGGISVSRSYNSNRNFSTFSHDSSGYIRTWLHNGPYKNNTQSTRLSQAYITDEGLVRPNTYSSSQNNLWLPASEPNTSYIHYDWIFDGLGAYQRGRAVNVAAYSHVYVYSPDDRTVQLRMGSDDGIKVWLNGEMVHNNDVYRGLVLDSDIKNVNLKSGWNSLLVKTSQATHGWHMSARFLTPEGSVLDDLKYSLNDPDIFATEGVLGSGWQAGFEEMLYTKNPKEVYFRDVTGTVNQYISTGVGSYTKPAGTQLVLTTNDQNYILTAKDGSQKVFDLLGKIVEARDLSGNKIVYHRNDKDQVVKITDLGREINLTYHEDGKLASVYNLVGQSIVYNYESGRLARVIDNDGYSYKYGYDDSGRIVSYRDKKDGETRFVYEGGKVVKITDAMGHTTSLGYASSKTTVTDAKNRNFVYTFDSANLVSTFTNSKGHGEKYIHDKRYNRVESFPDLGSTDPYYYSYKYQYDANDNLAKETDPLGAVTSYTYQGSDLVRVTDPKGAVSENVYSTDGRRLLLSEKDSEGNTTTYEYDSFGRRVATTTPKGERTLSAFNEFGDLVSVTTPKNETTTFEFDVIGRKTKDISPLGKESLYEYDLLSRLKKITTPGDLATSYEYDPSGNKTKEINPNGTEKTWEYDVLDRVVVQRDEAGAETRYKYDEVGNKIEQTDAKGKTTRYEYDELNQLVREVDVTGDVSSLDYDRNGEVTSVTDPNGAKTSQSYDKAGQVTSETKPEGSISYSYDANGDVTNLKSNTKGVALYANNFNDGLMSGITPTSGSWSNIGGELSQTDKRLEYVRARINNVNFGNGTIEFRVKRVSAETPYFRVYFRDNSGERAYIGYVGSGWRVFSIHNGLEHDKHSVSAAMNQNTWYNIKVVAQNRNIKFYVNGSLVMDRNYTVDLAAGPMQLYSYGTDIRFDDISITSSGDEGVFGYDTNGNITKEGTVLSGSVTRSFDANENVTDIQSSSQSIGFTYDANGNVSGVSSLITSATQTSQTLGTYQAMALPVIGTSVFSRDAEGKLVSITKANGSIVGYGYDLAGRVNSVTASKNGNILASFVYEYDKASNQTKITDFKGRVFNYSYDVRNQLTQDNFAEYRYDIVGNRTEMITSEGVARYFYDEGAYGNRLLRVEYPTGRTVMFEYDKNGNATRKTDSTNGITTYKYDSEDYFVEALLPDGTKVEYTYDEVEKRRTQRKITRPSGVVEIINFTFDGDKLMTETDLSGKVIRSYTWDEDENLISVAMPDANGTLRYFYFVKNAKGDVVGLSDSNGSLVAEYEYDSWGNILKSETLSTSLGEDFAKSNPRLYGSYWYDEVLGQYFMKARMYDPEIGRFYSQDPLEDEDENLSQNPYIYCSNNPIDRVDPDGKSWLKKSWNWAKKNKTKIIAGVAITAGVALSLTGVGTLAGAALIGAASGALISGGIAYSQGARGKALVKQTVKGAAIGVFTGGLGHAATTLKGAQLAARNASKATKMNNSGAKNVNALAGTNAHKAWTDHMVKRGMPGTFNKSMGKGRIDWTIGKLGFDLKPTNQIGTTHMVRQFAKYRKAGFFTIPIPY